MPIPMSFRRHLFKRIVPPAMVLLVGVAISIVAFLSARHMEARRIQLEFDARAASVEPVISRRVGTNLEVLDSIERFFAASNDVDHQEFVEFTRDALVSHPGLRALAWSPRRTEGGVDKFAITFVAPHQADPLLRVELTDNPRCAAAMIASVDNNQLVGTDSVSFLVTEGGHAHFDSVVFRPIYAKGKPTTSPAQRHDSLQGYVVACIELTRMMDSAMSGLDLRGQEVRLVDPDSEQSLPIYTSRRPGMSVYRLRDDITPWRRPISVAGRQWWLTGLPTSEYAAEQPQLPVWVIPVVGTIFTFLLGMYLYGLSGRTAKVESLVEQRTAELRKTHRQLEENHEKLKLAQTAMVQSEKLAGLGQMVAGVAHEINNPLAFVSNNVAVLQRDLRSMSDLIKLYAQGEGVLKQHNTELLGQITALAQRMDIAYTMTNLDEVLIRSREGLKRIQQIVKDLREFARLDAGEMCDADINAGIESTLNIVRGVAKKKQVTLETRLELLPPVSCHQAKVNQVIMNLVTNAIDACNDNGKVTVCTARQHDAVRITVTDNGKGIAPEVRQRIFDPFFTTKPIGQGTGLGLSISYGIVHDHGGQIDVASEVGQGTTVTVTLPLRRK